MGKMTEDGHKLARYESKRIVNAGKIISYDEDYEIADLFPLTTMVVEDAEGNPVEVQLDSEILSRNGLEVGATLIVYEDGYCGICPAPQFESGYSKI